MIQVLYDSGATFVQAKAFFVCNKHDVIKACSKGLGYCGVCRDPKCSFQCQRAFGAKESSIQVAYLQTLDASFKVFRGSLKLPENANQKAHDIALVALRKRLQKIEKSNKIILRWRGRVHATNETNKHYDFVLYSNGKSIRFVKRLWKEICSESGFCKVSIRPIDTLQQLIGWSNYQHKRYVRPKKDEEFVFLLAKDGNDTIVGSKNFYIGTT